MKQSAASHSHSRSRFVYIITFLWFILSVYKSHVCCLSLESDLIQLRLEGNDHSQNQHATVKSATDKTNPKENKNENDSSIKSDSTVFLTQEADSKLNSETANECEDELTQQVCRHFVENNLCEQKGNPNVSRCQRSCKLCLGGDEEVKTVDLGNSTARENVNESESWDRKKDENNKDCYDLFPNCTCRNVSNIVTCCNWINAQNLNNIPCRKSCGICGGNGVFSNKPPGSSIKRETPTNQNQDRKPTRPNFDAFCRPNPTIPIIEPNTTNTNPDNTNTNILMPFSPPSFPGATANMC